MSHVFLFSFVTLSIHSSFPALAFSSSSSIYLFIFWIFLLQLPLSCLDEANYTKKCGNSLLCSFLSVVTILHCTHGQAVWTPTGFISAFFGLHCRSLLIASHCLCIKFGLQQEPEQKQFVLS